MGVWTLNAEAVAITRAITRRVRVEFMVMVYGTWWSVPGCSNVMAVVDDESQQATRSDWLPAALLLLLVVKEGLKKTSEQKRWVWARKSNNNLHVVIKETSNRNNGVPLFSILYNQAITTNSSVSLLQPLESMSQAVRKVHITRAEGYCSNTGPLAPLFKSRSALYRILNLDVLLAAGVGAK